MNSLRGSKVNKCKINLIYSLYVLFSKKCSKSSLIFFSALLSLFQGCLKIPNAWIVFILLCMCTWYMLVFMENRTYFWIHMHHQHYSFSAQLCCTNRLPWRCTLDKCGAQGPDPRFPIGAWRGYRPRWEGALTSDTVGFWQKCLSKRKNRVPLEGGRPYLDPAADPALRQVIRLRWIQIDNLAMAYNR